MVKTRRNIPFRTSPSKIQNKNQGEASNGFCENYFHFNIKDGRAKPIDFLARYLDVLQGKDAPDTDLHEPYIYMNGLDKTELEDLQADINVSKKCEHLESITSGLSEYSRA